MIRYIILAFLLDFISTIIQSPSAEENPIVRGIWESFGWFGVFYFDLLAMGVVIAIWVAVKSYTRLELQVGGALFLLCTFRIVVALQNFGILPYYFTSWLY